MNPYFELVRRGGLNLMSEILADPLSPSCYHLFPGRESKNPNGLVLICFASRGRAREAFKAARSGKSGLVNAATVTGICC